MGSRVAFSNALALKNRVFNAIRAIFMEISCGFTRELQKIPLIFIIFL
jgi:hypothetical protein